MHDEEPGSERTPLVGKVLCGKWRIERLIGRGGMGAVYEATHRNGLKVAVKVLQPERASSSRMRARFVREGYVANKVGHPGVVAVLDDDVDDTGEVFLVMELLRGENLAKRAEGGPLALEAVLRVAESVLDILAAAHDKGIVHRDVKPENVFMTNEGEVKLLDFGLARLREREATAANHTESGTALGTLGFMAPEQARGRWDHVDGRTDVWAVGALMFRLLAGRPVHRATTPNELLIAAATEPAPSLAVRVPELPADVVALVDRALAFERERRWSSAGEMLAALRAVQERTAPAVLSRSFAGATVPVLIGDATERTASPVTAEPAPIRRKPVRRSRWRLGLVTMAGIAAAFALTLQAVRGNGPTPAGSQPSGGLAAADEKRTPLAARESVSERNLLVASSTAQLSASSPLEAAGRADATRTPRNRMLGSKDTRPAASASSRPLSSAVNVSDPPPVAPSESASGRSQGDILDVFE